ncbi:hypothetical protein [Halobacillus litoralis]|uniref:hypothetical protein n=1 Tax=Halobacillus litoralis TaxID=45668 RepID=UPI001CFD7E5A|nr:hypothetical protein [Halobacillus litoralis]
MSPEEAAEAKELLTAVIDYQIALSETTFVKELIDRAAPILWLGEKKTGNIVTIGTNPTSHAYRTIDHDIEHHGKEHPFACESYETLLKLKESSSDLEAIIDYYQSYFKGGNTYTRWFGKKEGGRLEGFMNGMGASFYSHDLPSYSPIVHVDHFPLPTRRSMGQIADKETLLYSTFIKEWMQGMLLFLAPSLIVLLGKEHVRQFEYAHKVRFNEITHVKGYPSARYRIGQLPDHAIPVIGLHFKPSEQFLGLGGKKDRHGTSHGHYGRSEVIRWFGEQIRKEWEESY